MSLRFTSLLAALAALATLAGCRSAGNNDPLSFSIACQSNYNPGDSVLLLLYTPRGFFPLDTATVDDRGRFTLQSALNDPSVVLIRHGKGNDSEMHEFVAQNGMHFEATLPKNDDGEPIIEGSDDNQWWVDMRKRQAQSYDEAGPWDQQFRNSEEGTEEHQQARAALDSIVRCIQSSTLNDIFAHIPSAFSEVVFMMTLDLYTDQQKQQVLDSLSANGGLSESAQQLQEHLEQLRLTAPGHHFTDFTQQTPDGANLTLGNIVAANKYTLVDFWASWCGPCRAEMPTVVKAYEVYKAKGLEILGVSLDSDRHRWTHMADSLHMTWPQVSDLRGWQNAAAAAYNVESIPSCFLIDQQGIIVARNLRGEALLNKLSELLDK